MLCCDYLLGLKGLYRQLPAPSSQPLLRGALSWTLFSAPRSHVFPGGRQDPVTSLCVWYKVLVSGPQVGQRWKGIAVAGHPKGLAKAVTLSEPTLPSVTLHYPPCFQRDGYDYICSTCVKGWPEHNKMKSALKKEEIRSSKEKHCH